MFVSMSSGCGRAGVALCASVAVVDSPHCPFVFLVCALVQQVWFCVGINFLGGLRIQTLLVSVVSFPLLWHQLFFFLSFGDSWPLAT